MPMLGATASSKRLDDLAKERKSKKTPKSQLFYAGKSTPERVADAPPSIWATK